MYSPEFKNRKITKTTAHGTCWFRFSFALTSLVSRLVKQVDRLGGDVTTALTFSSSFSHLFAFEILTWARSLDQDVRRLANESERDKNPYVHKLI